MKLTPFDKGRDLIIVGAEGWGPRASELVSLALDTGSSETGHDIDGLIEVRSRAGRSPDQWVGVVDIQKNSEAAYDIRSARVVCHSTNRGEVLDRVLPLRPRHDDARHLFTGRIRAPFPRFL